MKTKKFHRSATHLPVINLRETLDYYRDTLGFYEEWTEGKTDGGIRRDEMRMLFGEDASYARKINSDGAYFNLLWFVDNIDEIYSEFQKRSIEIISPLTVYPYGLREFSFIDINGYCIRIAEGVD